MPLTDSLVSYWKLDEASGNALDAHGSNELTDNNTVGSVTGKISNARDFELSATEYFSLADNASISVGDIDFTIAMWIQLESKAVSMTAIGQWDGGSNQRSWRIEYDQINDRLIFTVSSDGTGGGSQVIRSATTLGSPSLATWYYVVAWHDSVANTTNIQVNDGAVDSSAWSTGVHNSTAGFKLGATQNTAGTPWDGLIDEVGFWKRVLTTQERTDLYNSGNGLAYPFSTAYTRSVAGDQPASTGALTRIYQALRSVAGDQPASTGTLTRTLAALRALAGDMPASTGVLSALTVFLRSLAGNMPAATGALARTYQALRSLAGDQPTATGVLTRTAGAFARALSGVLGALSGVLSSTGGIRPDFRATVTLTEVTRHTVTITETQTATCTLTEAA